MAQEFNTYMGHPVFRNIVECIDKTYIDISMPANEPLVVIDFLVMLTFDGFCFVIIYDSATYFSEYN